MGLQGYQGHVPEQHMQQAPFNQRVNQDYSKV
jgi:hypothetical protein